MSDRKESVDSTEVGQAKLGDDAERVLSNALTVLLKAVLALAVVVYFAAAGIYLGLRYAVLPQINDFRPRIETLVSSKIHARLSIGRISAHWSGMQPTFDIDNIKMDTSDGQPGLVVPHASATISWSSLLHLAPVLSNLTVDGPDVIIARTADGELFVAGVPIPTRHKGNDAFTTWLLKQQSIVLHDGILRWRDAERSAPELALRRIKLLILNDGLHHRLALQAPADGQLLHGPLDFRADFQHEPFSAMGRPANWKGRAYVSTGPVDLPMLVRYIKTPFVMYGGRVDNRIWLDFAYGKLETAAGELTGADIGLRVHATQPRLDMPIANFSWALDQRDNEYTLQLGNLRAELGQPPMEDGTPVTRLLALHTLTGRYRPASVNRGLMFGVSGDRVDLGILNEFARALPLPTRFLNNLLRFNPRGIITNYTMETERGAPKTESEAREQTEKGTGDPTRYTFKGNLEGVSVQAQEPPPGLTINNHPRAGIPGVENLWGTVDADQDHGSATIDTKNTAITIPGVFDDPRLTFDTITGHLTWTVADAPGQPHKAFTAHVDRLRVKNADAEASLVADYKNTGSGRGSLDLSAKADHLLVTKLVRYLPTSLNENVRLYLGHALQGGMSRNGTIEIHGDLTRFPYSKFPDAGQFRIVAPFTGGKFDPTPFPPKTMANGTPNFWPAFDAIDGTFRLAENKLRFDVSRGRYHDVQVVKSTGRIEDLGNRDNRLIIDSEARGPLTDMLDYVENSSLGALSHHVATKIHASGNATLALQLQIPRKPPPPGKRQHVPYKGSLTFANDELAYEKFPPISELRGRANFGEKTASLDHLAGRFLGGEVHGTGGVKPDGTYAFDVSGRIGADAAKGMNLRKPATETLKHISGTAPYDLRVSGAKKELPRIEARSDLTGLGLDFPAPFNKPQGTPMPFAFDFTPVAGATDQHDATLTLGPVNAHYVLRGLSKTEVNGTGTENLSASGLANIKVLRGAIGVNKPADLPSEGVTAAIDIDRLDADAWRKLSLEISPPTAPTVAPVRASPASGLAKQFAPNRVAVHLTTLDLFNRRWENVVVGASRDIGDDTNKWQANIASNQVSGYLAWTPGKTKGGPGELQGRFAKIVIPDKSENDLVGQMIKRQTRNMPSVDLIVNELVMRGRTLGRLEMDAHNEMDNEVPVWYLDKLKLANPDATLLASANWRTLVAPGAEIEDDSPRKTSVDFKVDVADAGALTERFGLPQAIAGGKGSVTGKLGWDGGPNAPDLATLHGNVAVDLRHGQILKIKPGTAEAAKLIGVLSLQSLVHFLTLDFHDVAGKGLPFEKVTGTGVVQDGIGRTSDFTMVTSPARVEMTGQVDLPQKTQDLHVRVIPTLSAGAVAIGAAVINPLLGLGVLAGNLLLSKSIGKAFTTDYSITGPWSKPVVQRMKHDQGKIETPVPAGAN
jgi:uncharacterized protein (TIGR02099 family)